MPDTQGARTPFIQARTAERRRDPNPSGADGEPDQRPADRSAEQRTKYRFGFKRRRQSRSRPDEAEVNSKLDQIPALELGKGASRRGLRRCLSMR